MIVAIIPAAGQSVRMGRPKLLLPVAGRTVIEQVVAALKDAAIEEVLVVVGPGQEELASRAAAAGAEVHMMAEATPDMRATVQAGLAKCAELWQPDQWLLVPADHPTLDPAVVRQLIHARRDHPDASIVLPTWQGKRGHPALIDWRHAEAIRQLPAGQGINTYLRDQATETLELPAAGPEVLLDLDTPEDYQRLVRQIQKPPRP